jgi:Uma2 family endonuclease
MSTVSAIPWPLDWTLADLGNHLGNIPWERVRAFPLPGSATEGDALDSKARYGRICELIDGVLVEKTMGSYESMLAMVLGWALQDFVRKHQLGIVLGESGPLRILPGQVRVPDVSVILWQRFPGGRLPQEAVYAVAPDLAVEVLSQGNTPGEMQRKLREYFQAGVRLVWYVEPPTRSVRVFTSPENCTLVDKGNVLDGGEVLPGFQIALGEMFTRATQRRLSR